MGFNKSGPAGQINAAGNFTTHAGNGIITPANRLILVKAAINVQVTWIRIVTSVALEPVASNLAFHIFSESGSGIYHSGSVPTVVGLQSVVISQILPRGSYYLGLQCDRADTQFAGAGNGRAYYKPYKFIDGLAFPYASDISPSAMQDFPTTMATALATTSPVTPLLYLSQVA